MVKQFIKNIVVVNMGVHYKNVSTLQECLQIFNESVQEGPVNACKCYLKTWFRCSIHNNENSNVTKVQECNMVAKYRVGIIPQDNKEWVCKVCQIAICDA